MAEVGEVVVVEVFLDEETVDGGRRTEGGYLVLNHHIEEVVGGEFFVVIHEYARAHNPLSVQFAPYSLAPACVGYGEVYVVGREVLPICRRCDVSERICEVVSHHLGFASRAGCEVDERNVRILVSLRGYEGRGVLDSGIEILKTFRHFWTYGNEFFDGWGFRQRLFNVVEYNLVAAANDSLHAGGVVAIYEVVLGEKVSGGYYDCANLVDCCDCKPKLIMPFEDEHHAVALLDAEAHKV